MSMSFPTVIQRRVDSSPSGNRPEPKKGRPSYISVVLLGICLALFAGGTYWAARYNFSHVKMEELSLIQGGEFRGVHPEGFLIGCDDQVQFVGVDGSSFTLPVGHDDVVPSGPWILGVEPFSLSFTRPGAGSFESQTLPLAGGERPLPFLHGDALVTIRPRQASRFGEPWCLRTFSREGHLVWEQQIAYAPFTGICDDARMVVGALDISGGGTAWVICLSRRTGQVLWKATLGTGMWRHLAFSVDEGVWAVLDSGAYRLTCDGQVDWQYLVDGRIHSAAALSHILSLSLSHPTGSALAKVLGNAQVMVVQAGGQVLWRKNFMNGAPALFIHDEHLFVLESNRVSRFQPKAKEPLLSLRLDGCPISCAKDVILIDKGGLLSVAKFKMPSSAR